MATTTISFPDGLVTRVQVTCTGRGKAILWVWGDGPTGERVLRAVDLAYLQRRDEVNILLQEPRVTRET